MLLRKLCKNMIYHKFKLLLLIFVIKCCAQSGLVSLMNDIVPPCNQETLENISDDIEEINDIDHRSLVAITNDIAAQKENLFAQAERILQKCRSDFRMEPKHRHG